MSGVFHNMTPTPLTAGECVPPRLLCGGRTHSLGGEGGWGVNILEDARHSSVLYICKYFVITDFFRIYAAAIFSSATQFEVSEGLRGEFSCQARNLAGLGPKCSVKVCIVIYTF